MKGAWIMRKSRLKNPYHGAAVSICHTSGKLDKTHNTFLEKRMLDCKSDTRKAKGESEGMKKGMKFVSAMLVLSMLFAMLTSVGASEIELNELGTLPLTNADVTLTIGLPQNMLTTDYEDNYLTHYIEEKTGVKLDFQMFSSNGTEAQQQLSLMTAGDEKLPDILNLSVGETARYNYGADGFFIALNDYMENDNYFWNQTMDQYATEKEKADVLKFAASQDGNIYAFPSWYVDPNNAVSLYMSINKVWLDNLGLEVPKTTDELYEALKAFKEKDANGNGDPNDEIPLMGSTDGWSGNMNLFLLNAFLYDAFDGTRGYQLTAQDGKLSAPFVQDEYREGLRYIRKLVAEGLISETSYTQSQNELISIMCAEDDQDTLVGAFAGIPANAFSTMPQRSLDYVPITTLTGPDGVFYSPYTMLLPNYNVQITKDCQYPQLAFRLLDAFSEKTISMTIRYGEEGVDWSYVDDGLSRYAGASPDFSEQAIYKEMVNPALNGGLVWSTENNIVWHTSDFSTIPPALYAGNLVGEYDDKIREYVVNELCQSASVAHYSMHPSEMPIRIVFTEEERDELGDIENTIRNYVNESLTLFVMGAMDIETEWDAYLAELDAIGLQQYLEASQTAYDRLKAE